MRAMDLAAAVFGGLYAVGDGANAVVHQRAIDKARPDIERVDQRARESLEAPGLVGMHHPRLLAVSQAPIQIDHAADELRRENADAAIVEEIDAARLARLLEGGVVAEMRITVNDAETRKR